METIIKRTKLAIFDSNIRNTIISDQDIAYNETVFNELTNSFNKIVFGIESKKGTMGKVSSIYSQVLGIKNNEFLIEDVNSNLIEEITKFLNSEEISIDFDLLVFIAQNDNRKYLCAYVMEHKLGYTHSLNYEDGKPIANLLQYRTLISLKNTGLSNYLVVDVESLQTFTKENSKKAFDFIEKICDIRSFSTTKKILKVLDKAAKISINEVYDGNVQNYNEVNTEVAKYIESSEMMVPKDIIEQVFVDETSREIAYKEFQKNGIDITQTQKITEKEKEKALSSITFVTGSGIEIKLPASGSDDQIEYIQNDDGTLSVLIKNVKIKK